MVGNPLVELRRRMLDPRRKEARAAVQPFGGPPLRPAALGQAQPAQAAAPRVVAAVPSAGVQLDPATEARLRAEAEKAVRAEEARRQRAATMTRAIFGDAATGQPAGTQMPAQPSASPVNARPRVADVMPRAIFGDRATEPVPAELTGVVLNRPASEEPATVAPAVKPTTSIGLPSEHRRIAELAAAAAARGEPWTDEQRNAVLDQLRSNELARAAYAATIREAGNAPAADIQWANIQKNITAAEKERLDREARRAALMTQPRTELDAARRLETEIRKSPEGLAAYEAVLGAGGSEDEALLAGYKARAKEIMEAITKRRRMIETLGAEMTPEKREAYEEYIDKAAGVESPPRMVGVRHAEPIEEYRARMHKHVLERAGRQAELAQALRGDKQQALTAPPGTVDSGKQAAEGEKQTQEYLEHLLKTSDKDSDLYKAADYVWRVVKLRSITPANVVWDASKTPEGVRHYQNLFGSLWADKMRSHGFTNIEESANKLWAPSGEQQQVALPPVQVSAPVNEMKPDDWVKHLETLIKEHMQEHERATDNNLAKAIGARIADLQKVRNDFRNYKRTGKTVEATFQDAFVYLSVFGKDRAREIMMEHGFTFTEQPGQPPQKPGEKPKEGGETQTKEPENKRREPPAEREGTPPSNKSHGSRHTR